MGRACKAICCSCGTTATVLVSTTGRSGVSTWSSPVGGIRVVADGADELVDLEVASWPPCPACCQPRLRRDPNSTDLLFTDDLPPATPGAVLAGRRRSDRAS